MQREDVPSLHASALVDELAEFAADDVLVCLAVSKVLRAKLWEEETVKEELDELNLIEDDRAGEDRGRLVTNLTY